MRNSGITELRNNEPRPPTVISTVISVSAQAHDCPVYGEASRRLAGVCVRLHSLVNQPRTLEMEEGLPLFKIILCVFAISGVRISVNSEAC